MQDLVNSILSMTMDVYRQRENQDSYTGAIKREWLYYKTIDCHAKGVISNSATTRSSDKQIFDNRYINDQMIQVRTAERISSKEKVTNIKNADGSYIWTEQNFPDETPTVFEVVGTTPITDPFGRTIGYNSALKRSENQGIGI